MTEHDWLDYAAPFALGTLDDAERAAFEAHLEGCAACRAETHAVREALALVGQAAPPVAPPPELRERVLAHARRTPQIRVGPPGSIAQLRARPVLLPWLAAAAGLVLIAGSLALYWQARQQREAAEASLAQVRAEFWRLGGRLAEREEVIETLLERDVATATLAAAGERPPSMNLYWSRARGVVVIAARDLPPAPAGRTYQLWGIKSGEAPVSLGTFNTEPDGRATLALDVPAGLALDLSAVTEEPAGGSPQPTSQPFLVGEWRGGE